MLKKIYDENDKLVALIIGSRFEKDGIEFFTPSDFSQQLAYMRRHKGEVIAPHVHNRVDREIYRTQEVLFIRNGKVRVDLYSETQTFLTSVVLETGDVILLASGGHGFTMLAPTEMIEVKQGPYLGDQDKRRFNAFDDSNKRADG
ncbi:MAG: cupin domain-containing protein [Halobacteriota archaeon]